MNSQQTSSSIDQRSYNVLLSDGSVLAPSASGIVTNDTLGNPSRLDDSATDWSAFNDYKEHQSFCEKMLLDYQELKKTVRELETELVMWKNRRGLKINGDEVQTQYVSLLQKSDKQDRTITRLKITNEEYKAQIRGLMREIGRLTRQVQTLRSDLLAARSSQQTTQSNSIQYVQWTQPGQSYSQYQEPLQTGQWSRENQGMEPYLLAPQMEQGGNSLRDDDYWKVV
nr:hypothetical protein L204_06353 [Cryptococcus depauperatus CBS 7855]